ncbi:MAG: DUF3419 family protein [Paracoccaceae bacterium]
MSFFQNLNFSSSNEDGDTELSALTAASRVVCLTGSGTRPLDMLMSEADEVIALDVNPSQNALLFLKMAAMEVLEHAQFLAFIGITHSKDRMKVYRQFRHRLSPEMQVYWDQKQRLIASGVWYAGKWEKLLLWNARFLKLFRGRSIDALLNANTLDEQASIWALKFNDSHLQTALEMIGRKWVWQWVMREPAGEFLPGPKAVGLRLSQDFERSSTSFLFRDSDFATLIFRGHIDPDQALPTHLRLDNYEIVRKRLSKLRVVEGGLADLGTLGIKEVDGFSLSDFGSYTGPDIYAACWNGIIASAAPGAKFCERIFMNDLDLPSSEAIKEDDELSKHLTATDKAVIYRIRAGTIEPLN